METRNSKIMMNVIALALLMLTLFGLAAKPKEIVPLGTDITLLADGGTAISSVPYTINSSGYYYLTKNLQTAASDQNAIEVKADNVTIDLMGFSLIGRSAGNGHGIFMNGCKNVEIRNGTVRDFGSEGILEANWEQGISHRVIGVRAISNGDDGICLFGMDHLVRDCTALLNKGEGIFADDGSIVSSNISSKNDYSGIDLGAGCLVYNNIAIDNDSAGIWTEAGCLVLNNTSYLNAFGIYVEFYGSLIKGNTIRDNDLSNIHVEGTDNAIEENLVTDSDYGIYFQTFGNFYANNRGAGNTTCFGGPGKPSSGSVGDGGGNVCF